MANGHTKNHGQNISKVVNQVTSPANLSNNIGITVEGSSGNTLAPNNEDERQVVNPSVNSIKKIESKLGAVNKRQKE